MLDLMKVIQLIDLIFNIDQIRGTALFYFCRSLDPNRNYYDNESG